MNILKSHFRSKVTAGSRVTDMAELGKCIVLCMTCEPKLSKGKYGYERAKDIPVCRGICDGCGQYFGCATFLRPLGWIGEEHATRVHDER